MRRIKSKKEIAPMKIYRCESCDKILINLGEQNGTLGKTELVPGSVDAALEKHVPAVEVKGTTVLVKIGEVTHPMLPEHHIEWILLETKKGFQIKYLEAGDAPEAKFEISDDEPVAVYEYCNLHGLWKKEI
jgi:superoxide reductase